MLERHPIEVRLLRSLAKLDLHCGVRRAVEEVGAVRLRAPRVCLPTDEQLGDNSCSMASRRTVASSPLAAEDELREARDLHRLEARLWVLARRRQIVVQVLNAAVRIVVSRVGRQTTPSFGFTASSFAEPSSIESKLAPAVMVSVGVGLKVT